eukprot:GHVL01024906.1.p1 GENE.GHVL01024906.1~~GHVL01024906.1.p1  ORF type:complete len:430 (+),score=62.58 GHVL01024906.1:150-1292(+)
MSTETKVVNCPQMGDSITEGSINSWIKKVDDFADVDDVVCLVDTDKVSVEVKAEESCIIVSHAAEEGSVVLVGEPLYTITPAKAPESPKAESPKAETPKAEEPKTDSAPQESTQQAAAPQPPKKNPPTPAKSAAPAPKQEKTSGERTERRVPMTRIRQRIAERLKNAQNTAACLTTFNECDMGNIMALRKQVNEEFVAAHGCKFGFVSAFILAATKSMKKQPIMNAYIDGNEIVYNDYVDISCAVATPNGLLVPVIRDCEKKTIADIELNLVELAQKARKGGIALEDMVGGTFTVSNGGVYGSMMGTPILNPPQASILGMHGIFNRAVESREKKGEIVLRPMMYLALTYDHRLVDGREAVEFLKSIKNFIEEPYRMLLDL